MNPEAHELYLKARYFSGISGPKKAWGKAAGPLPPRHRYRSALCTRGYAGLADCYNILGYYCELSPGDAYPKARAAAHKVIGALMSTLPRLMPRLEW